VQDSDPDADSRDARFSGSENVLQRSPTFSEFNLTDFVYVDDDFETAVSQYRRIPIN
jgi:hypothetical protein